MWERMERSAGGKWPSHGFGSRADRANVAREIVKNHPNSDYYPYALVLTDRSAVKMSLDTAQDAVQRFRNSPAYPHLLLAAGLSAAHAADAARRRGAADEAVKALQLDRFFNEEALRMGSDAVRAQASVNSRRADSLLDEFRRSRAQQP